MNLQNYFPLFVDLMLKSTVILLLALLITQVWRRASAASRHMIWLGAFGVLLLLPFVTILSSRREEQPTGSDNVRVLLRVSASEPEHEWQSDSVSGRPMTTVGASTVSREGSVPGWRESVIGVWLAGVATLLGLRAIGRMRLWSICRRSEQIRDAQMIAACGRIAVENGIRRTVALRMARDCRVAMTWGTWRPVVMLPMAACSWTEERFVSVLRHELAHVQRRDCLARLCFQVVCMLYWPNPLTWLGVHRARLAQEQACDDHVLMAGDVSPGVYALELVAAARESCGPRFGPEVAMAERSTLETRLLSIMDEKRNRRTVHRSMVALTSWAALVALVGCSAVEVSDRPRPPAPVEKATDDKDIRSDTILLKACFVEIKEAPPAGSVLDILAKGKSLPSGGVVCVLTPEKRKTALAELKSFEGAKIVFMPEGRSMLAVAQDRPAAYLSDGHELRYPTRWRRNDDNKWLPDGFATAVVGTELRVIPRVNADGSFHMEVTPTYTEFEGFIALQADSFGVKIPDEIGPVLSEDELRSNGEKPLAPVFFVRTLTTDVNLVPGQTVVLNCGMKKRMIGSHSEWRPADVSNTAAPVISLVLVTAESKPFVQSR